MSNPEAEDNPSSSKQHNEEQDEDDGFERIDANQGVEPVDEADAKAQAEFDANERLASTVLERLVEDADPQVIVALGNLKREMEELGVGNDAQVVRMRALAERLEREREGVFGEREGN